MGILSDFEYEVYEAEESSVLISGMNAKFANKIAHRMPELTNGDKLKKEAKKLYKDDPEGAIAKMEEALGLYSRLLARINKHDQDHPNSSKSTSKAYIEYCVDSCRAYLIKWKNHDERKIKTIINDLRNERESISKSTESWYSDYGYLDAEATEGLKNKILTTTDNFKNKFAKRPSGFRSDEDAVWAFLLTSIDQHSVDSKDLQTTLDSLDRVINYFCYKKQLTCAMKRYSNLIDSSNKPTGKVVPYAILNKHEKPYMLICMSNGKSGGFAISYVYSVINKEPTKSQLLKFLYD
mgnify:FL=1